MKVRMIDGFEAEIKTAKIVKRFPEFKKLAHRFDARNYLVVMSSHTIFARMRAAVIVGDELFRYEGPVSNVRSFRECTLVSDRKRIF